MARLQWRGLKNDPGSFPCDPEANARHASVISASDSSVDVQVIPTNEEWMMAHHAQTLLAL